MRFEDLRKEIIKESKCSLCGGCEAICPIEVIEVNSKPNLIGECIRCGNCYQVCPATSTDKEPNEIKKYFSSKSKDAAILENSQNGGVASTILKNLLEKNQIDAAIVTDKEKWKPIPRVITKAEEVVETAGTKYGLVPLLKKVREASSHGDIAIVGTPCHIEAAASLRQKNIGNISYLISIFCMQNFNYDCLINNRLRKKGFKVEEIERIGISSGKLSVKSPDREEVIDVSEIQDCSAKACDYCGDFEGMYSDISIGSVGSDQAYSTVLIRTQKGVKAIELSSDDLEKKELEDIDLVKKLNKIKKSNQDV